MCWKTKYFQMPKHKTFDYCFATLSLRANISFPLLFNCISCGSVRIPAEWLKCPHIHYRFFNELHFLLSFVCTMSGEPGMPLPLYPFTLSNIDLLKRDRCKAAVTQGRIWCRKPAGCVKKKERKRQERYNGIMQS